MTNRWRPYKEKDRKMNRKRNPIARDLGNEKFRMRRVESKKDKNEKYPQRIWNDELDEE